MYALTDYAFLNPPAASLYTLYFSPLLTGKEIISHKVQDDLKFMTESGKYQFVAGSSILLPCEVSQPGKSITVII